jgi:hypothetical protein
LEGASSGTFVVCTSPNDYFTLAPFVQMVPFPRAFILSFPLGAPSFSSQFSFKVTMGVCLCYEGLCPFTTNFDLFKNHYYFASFSSSRFVLAMFRFFDGDQASGKLGFFLDMFMLKFIHSTHLLARRPSNMVFKHFQDVFDQQDLANGFSQLFLVCCYVDVGCIPGNIAKAFGVTRLLTLANLLEAFGQ